MLASHPCPANPAPPSVENPHLGAATKSSNECCSYLPLLRLKATPPRGPTTTKNAPKANATTKPSSPSPDEELTCCSPCSETGRSTNLAQHNLLQQLDEHDRSTPQAISKGHTP